MADYVGRSCAQPDPLETSLASAALRVVDGIHVEHVSTCMYMAPPVIRVPHVVTCSVRVEHMNLSEQIAYDWLLGQGIEASEIVFRSRITPDFIVGGGRGYEVKRLYGNTIRFSAGQVDRLVEYGDAEVLIVDRGEVIGQLEAAAFLGRPLKVGAFGVSYEAAGIGTTIKIPVRVRDLTVELQETLTNRGLQILPPCMKGLFGNGPTQGAIVEAGLLLLKDRLKAKRK